MNKIQKRCWSNYTGYSIRKVMEYFEYRSCYNRFYIQIFVFNILYNKILYISHVWN